MAAPIALFAYIVVLDWRLALLALATLPIYFGIQMFSVAGMDEKTALMDTKIGIVSSTVVEFASGIAVVKAFGRNGKRYANMNVPPTTSSSSTTTGAVRWCAGVPFRRPSSHLP